MRSKESIFLVVLCILSMTTIAGFSKTADSFSINGGQITTQNYQLYSNTEPHDIIIDFSSISNPTTAYLVLQYHDGNGKQLQDYEFFGDPGQYRINNVVSVNLQAQFISGGTVSGSYTINDLGTVQQAVNKAISLPFKIAMLVLPTLAVLVVIYSAHRSWKKA